MINDIHDPRIRGGNASSTVSRHYFLQMATNIIDDADDIANFNGKILSWMYMDLQESDNMTITRCDILHDTLVHDSDCSYTFLLLVGKHLSFRRQVWILELVRIFLLVFEWLQGFPRTIKTSSENTETDENTWCARVVALYRES